MLFVHHSILETAAICDSTDIIAKYEGTVASPGNANGGQVDCTLTMKSIPRYTMIKFTLSSLVLPSPCCLTTGSAKDCNSLNVTVSGQTIDLCSQNGQPDYVYKNDVGNVIVSFKAANYTSGQGFNLTYKGKRQLNTVICLCTNLV